MAKKTATKKKGGSTKIVEVDFKDVEGRGGKKSAGQSRYKPGDYAVKVKKAYWDKSGAKGTKQLVLQYVFTDGKYKGKSMYHRCNLLPQSLWVLRNALEAMGVKVPSKRFKVDPKKLPNKKLAITIEDDEYKDKKSKKTRVSSKVTDTFSLEELEEAEEAPELDEDEDEEEDEDDDDETEDEEDEEDEDEEEEDDDEEDEDDDDDEIEEVDEDDL
jgi:hypothetical protein